MKEYKNILVVRTDKIGDIVLTLPVAGILKKQFPGAKITFLVQEYTKPLVEQCSDIDEVLSLKREGSKILFSENIKMLKNHNFDLCITVSPKFKLALILKFAGIKTRIGTGYRWYSFLFNKKIYEHRKTAERHELEYNARLLTPLDIKPEVSSESVEFNIQTSKETDSKVKQLLLDKKIDLSKKCVIIHPGSGGSAVDWPQSRFLELTRQMAQELDINILVTGLETEKSLCEKLVVSQNVYNLAGKFDLSEMISVIGFSEMMIANSTGPIHIAAAMKKIAVGFYPKIRVCSKERWGPYTDKKFVFEPENCSIEHNRKLCEENDCMRSINSEQVFEKIKNLLEGEK